MRDCDPSQLFGLWMCEPAYLTRYVDLARGADLQALRAEARAVAAAPKNAPRRYDLTVDGIAVIDLAGPLTKHETTFAALFGGTSMVAARAALRDASRASDVDGIMVKVDSPGGTVAGGAELAEDIRRAAARKPLHTFADDLAASGGLLALAQGSKVWAGPSAEVGSLGVYTVIEDTSGRYAQEGVKVHVVSSAPPLKGAGVEGTEITAQQLAEWQRRVSDTAAWFVGEVATGRKLPPAVIRPLATGEVWIAPKAQALGLVDGVLTFDEAMARLQAEVDAHLDQRARAMARRQVPQQPGLVAPVAAPARVAAASPQQNTAAERAEAMKAEAKRRGITLTAYCRTPEGATAYRAYREAALA